MEARAIIGDGHLDAAHLQRLPEDSGSDACTESETCEVAVASILSSPAHEPVAELSTLPSEMLLQIAMHAICVADVGRLAMVSRRFGLPDEQSCQTSSQSPARRAATSISEEALYARARESFQVLAKVKEPTWSENQVMHKLAQDVDAYRRGIRWSSLGPMALRLELCSRCGLSASGPSPMRIFIQVRLENGRNIIFQCRLSTKLGKLFAAFCHHEGFERCGEAELARGDVLFYFNGMLLKWDDTPAALDMQIGTMDDAVIIDVWHREPERARARSEFDDLVAGIEEASVRHEEARARVSRRLALLGSNSRAQGAYLPTRAGKMPIVYPEDTRVLRRGMSGLRI